MLVYIYHRQDILNILLCNAILVNEPVTCRLVNDGSRLKQSKNLVNMVIQPESLAQLRYEVA